MLIREFENLTGIYPSMNLYTAIEKCYHESDMDKQDFCRAYKYNENGLAEKIQSEANKLESDAETLKYQVKLLQEELDIELKWKDSYIHGTNMKECNYVNFFQSADSNLLEDEEAARYLYDQFGFAQERIEIIHEASTYEVNKYDQIRVKNTYQRDPLYVSDDRNYIRFDCAGRSWELINGELLTYETKNAEKESDCHD